MRTYFKAAKIGTGEDGETLYAVRAGRKTIKVKADSRRHAHRRARLVVRGKLTEAEAVE